MRKKRSSWKCLTSVLALSLGITLSALPGCKSVSSTIATSATSTTSAARATTLDSTAILLRDSIVYRERTIHDTVYITKELYRDRLEARGERQKAVRTDTVVVTEYRDKIIEHPPERYVPKFYRWCTVLLFAMLALLVLRWWLKRRL